VVLNGYSAHGDRHELQEWLDTVRSGGKSAAIPEVYLVHGEREAQDAFAGQLVQAGYPSVHVPERHAVATL
jgi:metallo-beta-lactamase family protein